MNVAARLCSGITVLSLAGCAGAHFAVKADSARYPISLSPALRAADGRTLFLDEELRSLGACELDHSPVAVFYGAGGGDLDLSDDLNGCVERLGGEGIVSLAVAVSNCGSGYVLFPLTVLPIYPGCMNVHVSAIVVSRAAPAGAAVAREGATP